MTSETQFILFLVVAIAATILRRLFCRVDIAAGDGEAS